MLVVRDSTHDQASLQLHEFQEKLTAAGALAKFKFLSCLPISLTRSFVLQLVTRTRTVVCQAALNSSVPVFPCPLRCFHRCSA